ncbi:MAG: acyltransferase [Bacteroidia bacterium]|nr:acyltransferase [Bacteroidia bacterium]
MNPIKIKYFNHLDALRLICFGFIFFRHGFFTNDRSIEQEFLKSWRKDYFSVSAVGLDFFSVLSSFLITWLILKEYKLFDGFNLKNFYMRRILRIWPLYFLILAIAYIAIPFICHFTGYATPQLPPAFWMISFTTNYYAGYINEHFLFFLLFLWFIAVEEQFYLVWGFLLKYFKKHLTIISIIFIVSFLIIKIFLGSPTFPAFYDTINYIPNFVIGAFFARLSIEQNNLFSSLRMWTKTRWILVYIVLLLVLVFYKPLFTGPMDHLKHIFLSVLFGLVIFENTCIEKPLFNIGKYRFINYLGKISFGLYCWHGVAITIILKTMEAAGHKDNLWDVFLFYPLISLSLTIILSIVSFELYEKRFLKLKQYFSALEQ